MTLPDPAARPPAADGAGLQWAIATLEHQHHMGNLWKDKAMTIPVCSECEERWPCPTILVVEAARPAPHESCREGAAALREQLRGADLGKANLRVKLTEATARAERLEGLLREALEGLDALVDDPCDPAVRKLLRRIRAALEAR